MSAGWWDFTEFFLNIHGASIPSETKHLFYVKRIVGIGWDVGSDRWPGGLGGHWRPLRIMIQVYTG